MEINLKFFNPANVDRNIKATTHRTGRLGFTIEAANKFKLAPKMSFKIATNEADESDTNLYAVLYSTIEEQSFRVLKAGKYYSINLKPLFNQINLDYVNTTYIYDITDETIQGIEMLVFKRRAPKKEKKQEITTKTDD